MLLNIIQKKQYYQNLLCPYYKNYLDMATTINHNRTCPHCNGEPILEIKRGKPIGFIFRGRDTIVMCGHCEMGMQKPKKVVHLTDRVEPKIVY